MATQPTFTPGPWNADFHNERRDGGRFVTMVNGGNQLVPIAAVPSGVEGYGREEGRLNARLIAAAPDLLEALESIERHVAHGKLGDWSIALNEIRKAASAAIAKATGAL